MKTNCMTLASVSSAALLALLSCETQDPSAIGEIQRDLAEAVAKNSSLEGEISDLKNQLEQASQQPAPEPESIKMPAREEIEKSLAIEATKLQQIARDLHPSAKVEGISTFDLDIPSFESPFSCKAKVMLREPSGELKTLYWSGNANMKGEWKFEKAENLEPAQLAGSQGKPDGGAGNTDNTKKLNMVDPVLEPKEPATPAPPVQPEKPKIRFDIPLDNPVLKPGGR